VVLDSLAKKGEITAAGPNFANMAAPPFGNWISLDGVHPSSAAHRLITNYLIDAINKQYNTSLARITVP
jgi:phospholipase/lecithinase/hemolysin